MFRPCDHHQGAALFLAKITLLKTFTDWFLYNNYNNILETCCHNTKLL